MRLTEKWGLSGCWMMKELNIDISMTFILPKNINYMKK